MLRVLACRFPNSASFDGRVDVYPSPGKLRTGYVVDVQADLLSELETRVVVPMLPEELAPKAARGLNPAFDIDGHPHRMLTQFIAAGSNGLKQSFPLSFVYWVTHAGADFIKRYAEGRAISWTLQAPRKPTYSAAPLPISRFSHQNTRPARKRQRMIRRIRQIKADYGRRGCESSSCAISRDFLARDYLGAVRRDLRGQGEAL